jgi:nitrite reductase/ring-hydroxylating ferredoxin subunit
VFRFPKPAEASWTQHYPHLGTDPVSYRDAVSPAWFELEREAIFRRTWLHLGRVEQVPRPGSYFTRELLAAGTSIIVVRGADGEVRTFHNLCRHRGNELVWNDYPERETSGMARQFACKYHGWRYGLDGACTFVQQQDEFFDLDRADYGLVPVQSDTFAGFIFVNVAGMTALAIFPNVEIALWQSGWYRCYEFWPTGHDSVRFQARLCWLPARNATERIGREMAAVAFKEYALQDAKTLEATQMSLTAEVVDRFPLNDQEVLIRHFHQAVAEHVARFCPAD